MGSPENEIIVKTNMYSTTRRKNSFLIIHIKKVKLIKDGIVSFWMNTKIFSSNEIIFITVVERVTKKNFHINSYTSNNDIDLQYNVHFSVYGLQHTYYHKIVSFKDKNEKI